MTLNWLNYYIHWNVKIIVNS